VSPENLLAFWQFEPNSQKAGHSEVLCAGIVLLKKFKLARSEDWVGGTYAKISPKM
jgi:hypothetical protein